MNSNNKFYNLINKYYAISDIRNKKLFDEFLIKGYRLTTLSSVIDLEKQVFLKLHLGLIITLIDDLADNPKFIDPKLLEKINSHILFGNDLKNKSLNERQLSIYNLASYLIKNLKNELSSLPHYNYFKNLFHFDLSNILLANNYSLLISKNYNFASSFEIKNLLPYNMGIIAAGSIDLMSVNNLNFFEIGKIRDLFNITQRIARISNIVSTYKRELLEKDQTNEIIFLNKQSLHCTIQTNKNLNIELTCLFKKGEEVSNKIKSFNAFQYLDSFKSLHELHLNMEGII